MAYTNIILQETVNLATSIFYTNTSNRWIPNNFITNSPTTKYPNAYDVDLEHFCAPVVSPTTGKTLTQYRELAKDPATRCAWLDP